MACNGCSTGRGNYNDTTQTVPAGCGSNGSCGTSSGCNKLNVFDWLGNMNLPEGQKPCAIVEIRFKNSRKEYFNNVHNFSLNVGDVVAVEAAQGHDIGVVSLTGELVKLQLKKKNISEGEEFKKIYRKAKDTDIEKWKEAQSLEVSSMYKARTIALRLGLQMKLSDVEYQGDKTKAIFYYTADERVDFRELIKLLAEEFKVRIEMRQIGARQEASRLGGIGACGRELCCSTWLTDFRTVSTSAARYQQLSLNPLKLAGQCGKLKCCLNYELDAYVDALKAFPTLDNKPLQTMRGDAIHQKTDIFRNVMWFFYRNEPNSIFPVKSEDVKRVQELNKKGEKPEDFVQAVFENKVKETEDKPFENLVGQDSITRFDKQKSGGNRKKKKTKNNSDSRKPQSNQNTKASPNNSNSPNNKPKHKKKFHKKNPNNPPKNNKQ